MSLHCWWWVFLPAVFRDPKNIIEMGTSFERCKIFWNSICVCHLKREEIEPQNMVLIALFLIWISSHPLKMHAIYIFPLSLSLIKFKYMLAALTNQALLSHLINNPNVVRHFFSFQLNVNSMAACVKCKLNLLRLLFLFSLSRD